MIQKIDDDKIRWFVRKLHSEYEKNTLLRNWCDLQVYIEEEFGAERSLSRIGETTGIAEDEFNQIGSWTQMPIDIIQNVPTSEHVLSQFVRGITLGERNYLINRMDQLENPRYVQGEKTVGEIESLGKKISADTLLAPITDELREMRRDWGKSNSYQFWGEEFILSDGQKINVNWYSPDKDENVKGYGYLFNSTEVKLVQKWHGDSAEPKNFDHAERYDKLSLNRPLMVYFGKKSFTDDQEDNEQLQEKIHFLYRTVLSEPDINSNAVIQLRF